MKSEYNIFSKTSRHFNINRVRYQMNKKGKSFDEALRYIKCFIKKHGNDSLAIGRLKDRLQNLRNSDESYSNLDYSKLLTIYNKKQLSKKMNKYYTSNRMYQRLTGRIHTAKVKGDLKLMNELKILRNKYKKTTNKSV